MCSRGKTNCFSLQFLPGVGGVADLTARASQLLLLTPQELLVA